jgi:hypothetical protein
MYFWEKKTLLNLDISTRMEEIKSKISMNLLFCTHLFTGREESTKLWNKFEEAKII